MLKDAGYDEFLEANVKAGLADIEAGRVISLADAQQEWRQTLESVIKNRIYNGKDSVGYTYHLKHNFDDFKQALI